MKKLGFFIGATLSAVYVGQASAYEQQDDAEVVEERQLDSYNAKGIYVGSFLLLPSMTLGNEYNSNIYKTDKGRVSNVSSYIAHFKPGFSFASDWNRHALQLSLNTDITEYATQANNNNYHDIFLDINGRLDVLKDSNFSMGFKYNNLHGNRGSADQRGGGTPTFYNQEIINLAYHHKFNRLSLTPELESKRIDYKDTPTLGGGSLAMHTRSRWENIPSIRMGYEIQQGYEAFAKFIWKDVSYDTPVTSVGGRTVSQQRDSSGYNILTGMAFELTDLITGDMSIGYLHRDFVSNNLPTIAGVNGFVNLKWQPTALTGVSLGFSRDIRETTQTGVAGMLVTTVHTGVTHELLRNVILNAGAKYSRNDYNGFDAQNPTIANRTDRKGNIYGGNVGLKYLLNRNFSMDLAYTYESRDVNYILSNYQVHQVMFNVVGKI